MKKKYDVILYGATGFTGKQTVAYFNQNAPQKLRWAIAGRNQQKLEQVISEVFEDKKPVDFLVADSQDAHAIEELVSQTKVILTTVGPYALFGEHLIASCAKLGVDYVDITGETWFIRNMMDKYETIAQETGAKIIPFCGFDSVPSDLGNYLVANYIREQLNSETKAVQGFFTIKGGFNGGTLYSMLNMIESGAWKFMNDPALLLPPNPAGVQIVADQYLAKYQSDLKRWYTPFIMGIINTRVVNRSAALFCQWSEGYGRNFQYTESQKMTPLWNPIPAFLFANSFKAFNWMSSFSTVREIIRRFGPSPNQGPSEQAMNSGFYRLELFGYSTNGKKVKGIFSGKGDPGNRATVTFVCEAALSLALQRTQLPGGKARSGFLTPATGLGEVLIERLRQAEVNMEVQEM